MGVEASAESPRASTTSRSLLVISGAEMRAMLPLDVVVPAVEQAYVAHARGEAALYPVIREAVPEHSAVFGVKSGHWPARDAIGLKVAGYWPGNRTRGLDNHQALVMLLDPATGVPRAVLDGNFITFIRTAAAGGIGLKWLARSDARAAVVIGTGVQGEAQARALAWWRGADLELSAYEPLDTDDRALARAFCARLGEDGVSCRLAVSLEAAVRSADVVVTATPARAPLVQRVWLQPGTHINAIGADTKGKQEHEIATLRDAHVVVDDWRQASQLGESQHGLGVGLFDHARPDSIGDVIAGRAAGRRSAEELTLFDATGIALQDLAVADLAFRLSVERGLGQRIGMD